MANLDRSASATGSTGGTVEWNAEESFWRGNWQSRPSASADRGFDDLRCGYRYGAESAHRMSGRSWDDAESELRSGWDRYEHQGQCRWVNVKDGVRDAWDRVRNR